MTIDEFIDKLVTFTRARPRRWILHSNGDIRIGVCCPITCFSGLDAEYADEEGLAMGLSINDRQAIVDAADCNDDGDSLRRRLLEACELKEVKP